MGLDPHPSAIRLREAAGDGEAEPCATARHGAGAALERLEDPLPFAALDSRPVIDDANENL